ncbi:TfoX/Sxy family protein [Albibacterium profundi]|uniref:TfoX/Sxy family protein n=1 Tax=Albibacterium profundi TaxID=3134906 RepID=A0ABV5C9J7_9SPHI
MAYSTQLADRVREYLVQFPKLEIEEKKMFGGLAFLVNDKMCINIGEENLMCRFDPELTEDIAERVGFLPMIMKGKEYKGYCYVEPEGFRTKKDFEFWLNLCLDFNDRAKASKKG